MTQHRILASAFTCSPPGSPGFTGGEDILGWNLLIQIAKTHEVWALTQEEDRASIEDEIAARPISGLHFHYVSFPRWLKPLLKIQGGHQIYYYFWQMNAYLAARQLHKELGFDLFHHITYANDWMASFIGAMLPIPYVRGPGGGAHRTPKDIEQEYTLSGRIWEKCRRLGQWLFRHDPFFIKGQNRAVAIMVCNWDSMRHLPEKWSQKAHLFPVSGVSTEDLSLTFPRKKEQGKFKVLAAGSLIRVKGFGLAIKAFKLFAVKYPDSELTIVGAGPEESRLRTMIRDSGLEDKIDLPGAIPRDALLSKMASSDVLLFPSLRDGGGTVVIEAMSAAKPVVCLDIGGPGLHINEECGIKLVPTSPSETVRNLADALERLYLSEDLRIKLGQAARERVEREYHWDKLGDRLMTLYQPILHAE
jgi:glycosyltransferase involved in cell wall biosynthesis